MAVRLVERHHIEFQPQHAVSESERPRPSLAHLFTEKLPSVSRHVAGSVALAVAIGVLAIGAIYAAGRGWTLPFSEYPSARLTLAAIIGVLLSGVHTYVRGHRAVGHSLARAETLLCVAGALTMILIDNSVARAFGIAGAASIVRFRTPVDDPTDATVLFLLMALGMASGVGAFGLTLAGAAGVGLLLVAFGTFAPESRRRHVTIELVAGGHDFPSAHVQRVFARHSVVVEPAEWSQETDTRVKYRASVDEKLSLEAIGSELMDRSQGALQSVTWEIRKNASP